MAHQLVHSDTQIDGRITCSTTRREIIINMQMHTKNLTHVVCTTVYVYNSAKNKCPEVCTRYDFYLA